jgi:integrase
MARGELMGLRWSDLDLDAGKAPVDGTLDRKDRRRMACGSGPKTKHGRSSSAWAFDRVVLRSTALRSWKLSVAPAPGLRDDAYVFGTIGGWPRDRIASAGWKRFAAAKGLPKVTLHALRHSHASGTDRAWHRRRDCFRASGTAAPPSRCRFMRTCSTAAT